MNNDIVICIGAGISQIPYINEIKRRGYKVLCTDKNTQSPGKSLSDYFLPISTHDHENTPNLIKKKIGDINKIKGVIAPTTGPPYQTMQETRKLLGLSSHDEKKINIFMDKFEFRNFCNDNNFSSIQVFKNKVDKESFPLIQKPRFGGMGSKNIKMFFTLEDYKKYSNSEKLDEQYIHEKLILGKELAVDAIWDGSSIVFLNIGWHIFDIYSNIIIGSTSENDFDISHIESNVKKLITNFCVKIFNSPEYINMDLIVAKDFSLHIVEVEFVPADGILLAQSAFNYDLVKNYISTYLGNPIEPQNNRLTNSSIIYVTNNFPDPKNLCKKFNSTLQFNEINPFIINTPNEAHRFIGNYIITNSDSTKLNNNLSEISKSISFERFPND